MRRARPGRGPLSDVGPTRPSFRPMRAVEKGCNMLMVARFLWLALSVVVVIGYFILYRELGFAGLNEVIVVTLRGALDSMEYVSSRI